MRQDITATSGAPSSSAEDTPWTSKVDRPGNEPQMSKQKILRTTSKLDADESAA